jgi:hypothetical protein
MFCEKKHVFMMRMCAFLIEMILICTVDYLPIIISTGELLFIRVQHHIEISLLLTEIRSIILHIWSKNGYVLMML